MGVVVKFSCWGILGKSLELRDRCPGFSCGVQGARVQVYVSAGVFRGCGFYRVTTATPPWRQPRGKSQVNLPQMLPDSGSICSSVCMGVD